MTVNHRSNEQQFRTWLQQWPNVLQQLDTFVIGLKRRQICGSHKVAKQTVDLLRVMIGTTRWTTAGQLLDHIRSVARILTAAHPQEPVIGNVSRRVMYIVREEYVSKKKTTSNAQGSDAANLGVQAAGIMQPSLQTILGPTKVADYNTTIKDLRQAIMEGMAELIEEVDNYLQQIADQALEYIHANEVILTYGASSTVEAFLKAASKKRSFSVIVAEAAPSFGGHEIAKSLAQNNIDTTVINDSAVFALMARVNKVIIGTHAVMANGGLMAESGVHMVALAARQHSVPVVCVTGIFKLTPLYPHDCDMFDSLLAPSDVIHFDQLGHMSQKVNVINPAFDYIPPELVDLFITNMDGHQPSPSYIYRLLAELYNPEDYNLEQDEEDE